MYCIYIFFFYFKLFSWVWLRAQNLVRLRCSLLVTSRCYLYFSLLLVVVFSRWTCVPRVSEASGAGGVKRWRRRRKRSKPRASLTGALQRQAPENFTNGSSWACVGRGNAVNAHKHDTKQHSSSFPCSPTLLLVISRIRSCVVRSERWMQALVLLPSLLFTSQYCQRHPLETCWEERTRINNYSPLQHYFEM